jgi:crotonobetainyl-CoA:carnitine CoA-transferase CaiB-like acyl-CoA transferase
MRNFKPDATGPLQGLRILDMTRVVAGNELTVILADFGADVIKIETPGKGDDLRNWKTEGVSTHWKVYSRNKKSLTLNLRNDRAKAIFTKLIATADAVVENYRPGTMEKMGFGPDQLHEINPKLVLVRISGWGQDGMYQHKPGFGTLIEAMSGFAASNGFEDRPPVLPAFAMADMIAGLTGASAILAAIRHVEVNGGKGQVIDLPLFDPLFSIQGPLAANYKVTGKVPPRLGSRFTMAAPRNAYQCKDGKWVALSASTQGMWEQFAKSIGQEELIEDARFKTNSDRLKNVDELDDIVGAFMGTQDREYILDFFDKAGITVGPICDIADLIDHPYIADREIIVEVPDEELGTLPMHTVTARLSETPGEFFRAAPKLGEHNEEILGELGVDADELAKLADDGVI